MLPTIDFFYGELFVFWEANVISLDIHFLGIPKHQTWQSVVFFWPEIVGSFLHVTEKFYMFYGGEFGNGDMILMKVKIFGNCGKECLASIFDVEKLE